MGEDRSDGMRGHMTNKSSAGQGWRGQGWRSPREVRSEVGRDELIRLKFSIGNVELIDELNMLVSNFSPHQKELIARNGFGAFTNGMHRYRFDREYCLWLFSKVDSIGNLVRLNGTSKLRMFPEDVSKVFGIPCGGRKVWDVYLDRSMAFHDRIRQLIGAGRGDEPAS
ncbi:hypothetical protein ACP4OV_027283 [Aristida adscensionis]